MKKLLLLLLLSLPLSVSAKMLYEYGSFDERAVMAVQCGIIENVFDYYGDKETNLKLLGCLEDNFGATITTINATDYIKTSRTTINDNFTELNSKKLEASNYFATTTHPFISSLPSLNTVGTIGTGIWQGTDVGVAYGGTGTSTLTANSVLLGNGTNAIQSLPAGSNDQVLTLVGGVPAWQSSTLDESLQYNWTGDHTFTTGSTTFNGVNRFNGYTELDDVLISSSTVPYSTASTSAASVGLVNDYSVLLPYSTASDNLITSSDATTTNATASYVEQKSFFIYRLGTIRVSFGLHRLYGSGTTAYGRIYINGIAVGTERSNTSDYAPVIYTEDFTVKIGDRISLYSKDSSGGGIAYTNYYRVYYDKSSVSEVSWN